MRGFGAWSADSTFVFYELKVLPESGDVFDATIELLGYGLLYIFSRTLDAYKNCSLMKARTVQLRVLGTWDYYQKQAGKRTGPSKQLQDAISQNLNHFASACLPKCKMDFGFDTFPTGGLPARIVRKQVRAQHFRGERQTTRLYISS
jgi:hypothetical protein